MSHQAPSITRLLVIALSFIPIFIAQAIGQNVSGNKPIAARTWDFESNLDDWKKTGDAFDNQPFDGTTVQTNEQQFKNIGGDYWKGIPYPLGQNGSRLILTSDRATGTLTSDTFTVPATASYFSFLIGGSSDIRNERLELQVRSTSRADALEVVRAAGEWITTTQSAHSQLQSISTRDNDDYVTVLAATGINGPDNSLLDLLRQESVLLPSFLRNRTARLRILDDSITGHINVDYIRVTEFAQPPLHAPAFGYADYHTHPMTNIGFGALKGVNLLWGCPGGRYEDYQRDEKLIAQDIPHCIKNHGGGWLGEVFINSAENRINLDHGWLALGWDLIRFKIFHHKHSGGPEFRNFPSFLSGTHHQMHITQIRRNYDGGLRLLVALAVHNQGAEYVSSKTKNGGVEPSKERDVVLQQVKSTRELAKLNDDWMEVAFSPDEARDIIRRNKLAVVLGIEVDRLGELFLNSTKDEAGAKSELDKLWNLGIRAMIPVHAVDNWIGGAAVFSDTYNGQNDFLNRSDANHTHLYNVRRKDLKNVPARFFHVEEGCPTGELGKCVLYRLKEKQNRVSLAHVFKNFVWLEEVDAPYSNDGFKGHRNVNGLSDYGRTYIGELMNRGIILDIAHMSEKSVADTFSLIVQRLPRRLNCAGFAGGTAPEECYKEAYPTISSHIFFRSQALLNEQTTDKDFRPSEYQLSDSDLEILRRVGGVVGPMVWELPLHVDGVQQPAPFKNDCAMSSKGFGYAFRYALEKMNRVGVGMATDFTFIPGTGPRFGDNACYAYKLAKDPNGERGLNPGFYNIKQYDGVKYEDWVSRRVNVRKDVEIKPYRMGERKNPFDFNVEGLAHYGMVPDLLQDLKNLKMPTEDFAVLFSSAEAYIQMWEKTWKVAGCDHKECQNKPPEIPAPEKPFCPLSKKH